MNELVRLDWNSRQLTIIKQTVARDTNEGEFNLFIEYCRAKQLDPFSRQAIAIIFNKDKPDKRQMTIITTQEGLRAIASRCGDYRPSEDEPVYEYDNKLKGPINPLGIVKCVVTLWKQDKQAQWHKVNGTAYWDEFVPAKDEWAYSEEAGKRKPTGKKTIEENWRKMGRVMIAKCANSQALRAGWPEAFAGVYGEEEMDRARTDDLTASQLVELESQERRVKAIGMSKDEYEWSDDHGELHYLPAGKFGDYVINEMQKYEHTGTFDSAKTRNRESWKRFWAIHKDDAVQVSKKLEQIRDKLLTPDKVA